MSFVIEYQEDGKHRRLRFSSYYQYVCKKKELLGQELKCYADGADACGKVKNIKLSKNTKYEIEEFLNKVQDLDIHTLKRRAKITEE